MSRDCVVAIYDTFAEASVGIRALDDAGFPHEQVSFVTHQVEDHLPDDVVASEAAPHIEPQATRGATVGGLLGLLLGAPLLTIPGVGPLLMAGPVAAGMTGAVVGGFLGGLIAWGVHTDHVASYQQQVQDGKAMIVATGNGTQVAEAETVLGGTSPSELHVHTAL